MSNTTAGYVYLFTSRSLIKDSIFKLGRTKTSIKYRLSSLNTGQCKEDEELYEFNSWLVNDCSKWESDLHKHYVNQRVAREFYRFELGDLFDIAVRLQKDDTIVAECKIVRPPRELIRIAFIRSPFLRDLKYDIQNQFCIDKENCKFTDTYIKSYLISDIIPHFERHEREYYRSTRRVGKLYTILQKQLIPYIPARTKTIKEIVENFISKYANKYKKNKNNQIVNENNTCINVIPLLLYNLIDKEEKKIILNNKSKLKFLIAEKLDDYEYIEENITAIENWIMDQIEPSINKEDFVNVNDLKEQYKLQHNNFRLSDKEFTSIAKSLFINKGIYVLDKYRYTINKIKYGKRNCILNYKLKIIT